MNPEPKPEEVPPFPSPGQAIALTLFGAFLQGILFLLLVSGSEVRVAGSTVGTVEDIKVSQSGTAEVTFSVDGDYAPLRHPNAPRGALTAICAA